MPLAGLPLRLLLLLLVASTRLRLLLWIWRLLLPVVVLLAVLCVLVASLPPFFWLPRPPRRLRGTNTQAALRAHRARWGLQVRY